MKIKHVLKPGCEITIEQTNQQHRFILRGLPSNEGWRRDGLTPDNCYCHISICGGEFGGVFVRPGTVSEPWVSSFGGEVWPGAWPELFVSPPRSNYACGPNTLTELGLVSI